VDWINLTDHRAEKEPIFPLLAPIMVSFFAQNPRKNMASERRASERIFLEIFYTASERRANN
jgi:hypothetical protein